MNSSQLLFIKFEDKKTDNVDLVQYSAIILIMLSVIL